MLIHNDAELKRAFLMKLLPDLMKELCGKVEAVLKEKLNTASISTATLQDYVTHIVENKGDKVTGTIYIDDISAQAKEGWTEENGGKEWYSGRGVLRQFVSIDGSASHDGHTIVWNIVKMLEDKGAHGHIGNNPFDKIGMFDATVEECKDKLNVWVKEYLHKQGL